MCGGERTADEDGQGGGGERDDQRRACEERVDDPSDALANDGLPHIWKDTSRERPAGGAVNVQTGMLMCPVPVCDERPQRTLNHMTSGGLSAASCVGVGGRGLPISPRVLSSLREPKAMAGRRMAM